MATTPPVTTKPIDWAALVKKQWGEEYSKPEVVYEFTNNRKFEDTGSNGGPYNPS